MRKRTTSRAKETIKEATTKATEAVKETVEKTTVKASEVIEEAKDAAADIAKAPVVEEAKETVKKAVKEVAKNIDIKKFAETTIELPGFAVTMSSIEEAIKKDIKDKGIEGKEISVYVNVEQKAAYYTVDGQGSGCRAGSRCNNRTWKNRRRSTQTASPCRQSPWPKSRSSPCWARAAASVPAPTACSKN